MSEQSESANGDKPKGNPKRSLYCVFYALGDYGEESEVLDNGTWQACGQFEVTDNMGQRSARKQALAANPELRQRIDDGEVVWFMCVPRRSLHPFRSEMRVSDPRLVI